MSIGGTCLIVLFSTAIAAFAELYCNAGDFDMTKTRLIYRSITIGSLRTSMRLEAEMWSAIVEICERELIAVGDLVNLAHRSGGAGGRTNAVRNFVLAYFRAAANESMPGNADGLLSRQPRQTATPYSRVSNAH
jgi:predicted DNA-binding ribbon-helix-helix protein